jgi:hypothetical protein
MRRTKMSFKEINCEGKRRNDKRGRPRKYQDSFILAIFLYQTLKQYSYREVLQELKQLGHGIPSLNDYYYRVRHLDEGILKLLLEKVGQYLAGKNKDKIRCYIIVDTTGFAYRDIYNLNWRLGTEIRSVKSHIRLEIVIAVDDEDNAVIIVCETCGAYASEVKMLYRALNK